MRHIFLYLLDLFCRFLYPANENYFDTAASMPICPEALYALIETSMLVGNSNADNKTGLLLRSREEEARQVIADALNVPSDSIVFTSGATESNNIIIQGVVRAYVRQTGRRAHIVSSEIEHPSVLSVIQHLDVDYTLVRAGKDGKIQAQDIADALRENTVLVSIHALHHEIGVVQDIHSIYRICQSRSIPLHCDASQAFLRDVDLCGDFITISGHKIGAPKGIGAFFIRDRSLCEPLMYGGGREPLRPGTVPTALIVAFAAAVRQKALLADVSCQKMQRLRSALSDISSVQVITPQESRHILLLKIPGVFQKDLYEHLDDFVLARGSACGSSLDQEASPVMRSIGISSDEEVASFLRLSVHAHLGDRSIFALRKKLCNLQDEWHFDL